MRGPAYAATGRPLYLVDGYNVILNDRVFRKKGGLEERREYLLKLLDAYAAKKKVEITVVWDGPEMRGGGSSGGARVKSIYSSPYQKADDKIVRMVERTKERGRITVVSDDRRHIIGSIRQLGAGAMSVKDFLSLVGLPGSRNKGSGKAHAQEEKQNPVDDLSVDQWLELFRSKGQ